MPWGLPGGEGMGGFGIDRYIRGSRFWRTSSLRQLMTDSHRLSDGMKNQFAVAKVLHPFPKVMREYVW